MLRTSIVFGALFLIIHFGVYAQNSLAPANLSIYTVALQGISVSQPNVEIRLNSLQQFSSGIASAPLNNHIVIGSTSKYQVSVRTLSDFMIKDFRNSSIPVQIIELQTSLGTSLYGSNPNRPITTTIIPNLSLSSTNKVLITNGTPEVWRGFTMIYSIPANQMHYFLNVKEGNYQVTIIYTITPI